MTPSERLSAAVEALEQMDRDATEGPWWVAPDWDGEATVWTGTQAHLYTLLRELQFSDRLRVRNRNITIGLIHRRADIRFQRVIVKRDHIARCLGIHSGRLRVRNGRLHRVIGRYGRNACGAANCYKQNENCHQAAKNTFHGKFSSKLTTFTGKLQLLFQQAHYIMIAERKLHDNPIVTEILIFLRFPTGSTTPVKIQKPGFDCRERKVRRTICLRTIRILMMRIATR